MNDKRDGDDYVRFDPRNGRYLGNGNMHRKLIHGRAPDERGGHHGDNRRDDDGWYGRRRDDDDRRDDRGGRLAPGDCHGHREQRGDRLCDAFGRLRLAAPLGAEESAHAKQQQRAAPTRMPAETRVFAETRADVQSKVAADSGGPSCFDGVRVAGYYGPMKEQHENIPAKDARETNWWKQKENTNIKSNCIHPCGPSGGGMKSAKNVISPPLFRFDLITGLDSVERAGALCDACRAKCGLLRNVLDKVGFRGSLVEENSNINGVRHFKVMVNKLHTSTYDRYSIVFEYSAEKKMPVYQMRKLLAIFDKHESAGFLEWLGGAKGWRFDCPTTEGTSWKKCAVIQLNTLQEVFKLFAIDSQKYFFENSQRMVWRKQNELTDVVNDIRVWIETITPQSELTRKMLRNSSTGPDSLVHWAHHHPKSFHPLTVVSESTMSELVEGLIQLFQKEFHHSKRDPLGTRWRNHEKRRSTDFDLASKLCPEWTIDYLERRLNGDYACT